MGRKRTKRRKPATVPAQKAPTHPTPDPLDLPARPPGPGRSEIRQVFEAFHGPLPPPELLHKYEAILPGLADRITGMAEAEMGHRHGMEKRLCRSAVHTARLGMTLAFLITVLGLGGSFFLLYSGKSIAGLATFAGVLMSLVGVFVVGKRKPNPPPLDDP